MSRPSPLLPSLSPQDRAWLRALVWQTALALVLLVVVVSAGVAVLREPIVAASRYFVDGFGGPGLALGWFLSDVAPTPLLPDAFSTAGLLGGMSYPSVVAWGFAGSLAGGFVGLWIGRLLSETARYQRLMSGRGALIRDAVERYGVAALALTAVTPLPFSLGCWAAGAVRMPVWLWVAVAGLRIVRVGGYLAFVRMGLVSTGSLPG